MAVLTELPIKYLPIVQQIQAMLQAKFIQADALAEIAQKTKVE